MANYFFNDSSRISQKNGDVETGKIFVGGLSWDTTVEDLRQHFEKFGDISDCIVSLDSATGRSKGFGFVTFSDTSVVDQVLGETHNLQGRNIEPQRAKARGSGGSRGGFGGGGGFGSGGGGGGGSRKLYLGGLDDDLAESDIRDHFSAFGNVINVHLPVDRETGARRPFGFVEFDTEAEADRALAATSHSIAGRDVDVQKARADQGRGGWRGGRGGGGGSGRFGGGRGRGGRSFGNSGYDGGQHYSDFN